MKINRLMLLLLFMLVISSCRVSKNGAEPGDHQEDVIVNNSFESSAAASWNNLRTGNYEYYAPVDGKYYAVVEYRGRRFSYCF